MAEGLTYVSMPYNSPNPDVMVRRMVLFSMYVGESAARGEVPVSPMFFHFVLPHAPALGSDWAAWENYSKNLMRRCERMVVLGMPGWRESKGVKAEIAFAAEIGIPVFYHLGY